MKLLLLFVAMALTGEGYEHIGEHDGVDVYKRNGHAIDHAAEGNIDAPPAVVLKVLTDYASHPKWVHGLAVSRVLDRRDGALDDLSSGCICRCSTTATSRCTSSGAALATAGARSTSPR